MLLGDRLAGYVDFELDEDGSGDGLEVGDVNLTYAVHPWARGRGVAVDAVRLLCTLLREQRVGSRAAIRVEPDNVASVRVARAVGFDHVGDFVSTTETQESGEPVVFSRYVLALRGAHP